MSETPQEEILQATPKGDVRIRSGCTPEDIRRFVFDSQFGVHAQYRSLYTKRESLEKNAEQPGANVVLALSEDTHIIGFGVLAYPDPDERWAALGPGVMMEVKAIEVCRAWRSASLANAIIKMMLLSEEIEKKIIYMVGYSWTWDLEGTRKNAQQYRQMLIKLFEPFQFQEFQTNEPNICLKPENIFMGRVGTNVCQEMQQKFKWLRFGMLP